MSSTLKETFIRFLNSMRTVFEEDIALMEVIHRVGKLKQNIEETAEVKDETEFREIQIAISRVDYYLNKINDNIEVTPELVETASKELDSWFQEVKQKMQERKK